MTKTSSTHQIPVRLPRSDDTLPNPIGDNLVKKAAATASILLAISFSAPGIAAGEHSGHNGHTTQTPVKAQMAHGVVKKVDKPTGRVTVAHGPLVNLNMPAMTMMFRVKEAAWLSRMKEGDNIRFIANEVDGALTIIRFEP
ncbi:MAG: RND transporter [Betaproteobacteria bacterium]|nr:MAG: RND transporter [Betaproteobacteria bacterium]